MTHTDDSVRRRMKQVADLRARARRGGAKRDTDSGTLDAAFGACDDLVRDLAGSRLECDRLREAVNVEQAAWEQLFDAVPVAGVLTDASGTVRHVNTAAAALLNVSAQHLLGRELIVFSVDRESFLGVLLRLARGADHVRTTMMLRPRECRGLLVDAVITPASSGDPASWVWFLMPSPERSEEKGMQPRPSGRRPRTQSPPNALPEPHPGNG